MIDQLIQEMMRLDCQLLLAVNGLHAPYWDSVMYLVSDKYIWVPMYAMFLAVLLKNFSYKVVLTVLVTIGLIILFTDAFTSQIVRPMVARLRPSNLENPICGMVHIVDGVRGGRYGFPSAHAGNSFGFAFFICYLFRRNWLSVFMVAWALIVCYSRMYLGVHYFGDLFAGMLFALCGSTIAYHVLLRVNGPCHAEDLKYPYLPVWVGLAIFAGIFITSIFFRV
ncbi:phosphatase PAP2 family protein [Prevotella sp.]|uniref:phosphatase PAP2 family protein n=1 Tax=Prevotella sp. TaxID=59823 RepID=UPI002F930CEC